MKIFWILFVVLIGLTAVGWGVRACNIVGGATVGVAEKTFDADNIIDNYEWYFDAYSEIQAKSPQIAQHQKYLEAETDRKERINLRIELTAMQNSCRELAAKYNANSKKANRSIFKDHDLPHQLSATEHCD